jgi:hypothetical protein
VRTVAEALHNNTWIRDLNYRTGFTTTHLEQFVTLWTLLAPIELQQQEDDKLTWRFTRSGEYTSSSAYKAQFIGCAKTPELELIWKTWATPSCRFFVWLILQNRVWTSDSLTVGVGSQPLLPPLQSDDGDNTPPRLGLLLHTKGVEINFRLGRSKRL